MQSAIRNPQSAIPRVALDMTFPNRNLGGSGVYAHSLLRELGARDDVAPREISGPQRSGLGATLAWLLVGARRAVRHVKADLLHCPAFVAPRSPVPYMITLHDAGSWLFPQDFPLEWRVYNRFILPMQARRARAIITATETMRADLARYYRIEPMRIAVTPYGISDEFRRPVGPEAVAQMRARLGGSDPLLLFSGAPIGRKNLDIVLDALAGAAPGSMLARARLAISGGTPEVFPAYAEWIEAHGLAGRVEWLGRVPFEELPALYAAADVLVYPSFYEGFGLPPLEAMAVSTPVVASNASCLPEVLGDAALLVDPSGVRSFAEAVESVLARPELRDSLIARGRAWSARYTWARCAEETARIYRQVLKRDEAKS